MYIKNSTISILFRVIFIIACGAGLVMKLIRVSFSLNTVLGDFALIANALALVYFAYLIIAHPNRERGFFRGAVTIYMIVIFVVYYFMHFGVAGAAGAAETAFGSLPLSEYLLYFISPIMVFVDYLIFCRKGEFTAYCPAGWAILPILFNIIIFLVNRLGFFAATVPYFNFLGMNMIIALMVFLGIGYLLFVVDNLLNGRRR